jgi:hypothetical protein
MIDIKRTKKPTLFIFSSLTALAVAANLRPNSRYISKANGSGTRRKLIYIREKKKSIPICTLD